MNIKDNVMENNNVNENNQTILDYIEDQRPGNGRLVRVEMWCSKFGLKQNLIHSWSLKYKFKIIKLGVHKYAPEQQLVKSLQSYIETQEEIIDKRRARAAVLAQERKEIYETYLSLLGGKGTTNEGKKPENIVPEVNNTENEEEKKND